MVTTFAGNGIAGCVNGSAAAASFNNPRGIDIGQDGCIYIADQGNHVVRKITPQGAYITSALRIRIVNKPDICLHMLTNIPKGM
jgi:DNA-binding beta-propeller fold protein YncE